MFTTLHTLKQPVKVGLPDGTIKYINQVGSVQLNPHITLHNVFFVPVDPGMLLYITYPFGILMGLWVRSVH
ncbi:Large tegument protein deneddylase [Bienertia sinuspersici]